MAWVEPYQLFHLYKQDLSVQTKSRIEQQRGGKSSKAAITFSYASGTARRLTQNREGKVRKTLKPLCK